MSHFSGPFDDILAGFKNAQVLNASGSGTPIRFRQKDSEIAQRVSAEVAALAGDALRMSEALIVSSNNPNRLADLYLTPQMAKQSGRAVT
jgi:hypothetical protein